MAQPSLLFREQNSSLPSFHDCPSTQYKCVYECSTSGGHLIPPPYVMSAVFVEQR